MRQLAITLILFAMSVCVGWWRSGVDQRNDDPHSWRTFVIFALWSLLATWLQLEFR